MADPTQTLKKWLRAQPQQPHTITQLQALLDTFTDQYNHARPHPGHRLPTYAGTYVTLLVQDLNVRVIHAATGHLLRELTIDPRRDYQPTGRPPGRQPQKK